MAWASWCAHLLIGSEETTPDKTLMPPKNPETPPFHQASMLLLVRLPAYAANRTRRLIKSPKLHQGATGVAHLWMLAES